MNRVVGYIVTCKGYAGGMFFDRRDGQLYFGKPASMFDFRTQASRAIDRTIRDRRKKYDRDFEQEFGELKIQSIAKAEPLK